MNYILTYVFVGFYHLIQPKTNKQCGLRVKQMANDKEDFQWNSRKVKFATKYI